MISFQIEAAKDTWITCTGLESVVEEMRSAGNEDITIITSALEEIIKGLALKSKPGEHWTSVAPILPWKKHAHLRERIDQKMIDLKNSYGSLVHFVPKLSKLAFGTGNDEVHLVDKSKERFFNHVVKSSIKSFVRESTEEESTNDEEVIEKMEINDQTIVQGPAPRNRGNWKTSTPAGTFKQAKRKAQATVHDEELHLAKRMKSHYDLEEDLRELAARVERRWKSDALVLAKHDEQLDIIKNEKYLDRIVISGIYIEHLTGTLEERKPLMFEAVTEILKSFMDDPPAPTFASHLNSQIRTPRRVLEVRFGNVERALHVRKTYAAKILEFRKEKKFPQELNGVNIGRTLTKSTKIRIAILKGLAKIVNDNTEQQVYAFCLEYQIQPMLKIVVEIGDNKKTTRTFGFTEAIEHVAENFYIRDQDLVEAYTLAGNMKHLEQKFAVLRNGAFTRRKF